MATYQGSPFEAGIGPTQGDIVLFAACPPPEDLGFEPATGHWRKQLQLSDVQAVWESRPVGVFRGERCMVLDDLGDTLHIGYLGHDGFKAELLGYWQVDRGVFELVAPRSEVTDILEDRIEYRRPLGASPPVTGPGPVAGSDSSAYARPSERPSGQYSAPAGYTAGSGQYSVPAGYSPGSSGQHPAPAGYSQPGPADSGQLAGDNITASYLPMADSGTGIALPVATPAPLPLEAEALRAASARRTRPTSRRVTTANQATPPRPANAATPPVDDSAQAAAPRSQPGTVRVGPVRTGQRRAARAPQATERLFAELASLAGIPANSYAVGEVVDGALCLVPTEHGFEVFHSAGGARQELQVFATEESACFYLFGVLAAEAVRNGSLARVPAGLPSGQPRTT